MLRRGVTRNGASDALWAVTGRALPNGTVGAPYAQTLGATGGRPPHAFAVTSGSLPAGLTLASTGVLSGTPGSSGASSFTVSATDTVGCNGSLGYVLTIDPAPPPVPDFILGRGHGPPNPNEVRVFTNQGNATTVDFQAYAAGGHGVNVTSGRVSGGAFDRILTGPGPGPAYGPQVRAFNPDGTPMGKISFGWNFDGGPVSALPNLSFRAYGYDLGVLVTAGELDGMDAYEEIATAPGPGPLLAAIFRGFDYDAVRPALIPGFEVEPFIPWFYGGRVGAFDADDDGIADLLCGAGPDPGAGATVLAFTYTGGSLQQLPATPILPFAGNHGVNAAAGRLGI